jgi:hypothetical protein
MVHSARGDPRARTAEFKATAIRIEKLETAAEA